MTLAYFARDFANEFAEVARLAGVSLAKGDVCIEAQSAPHEPPKLLPEGKMAVYVFIHRSGVLKVGKVGPKSWRRYTYQHYKPGSAQSTLAASTIADAVHLELGEADMANIGSWIMKSTARVNILLPADLGIPILTLLESFLHCRLRPRYEGFKSQRG